MQFQYKIKFLFDDNLIENQKIKYWIDYWIDRIEKNLIKKKTSNTKIISFLHGHE